MTPKYSVPCSNKLQLDLILSQILCPSRFSVLMLFSHLPLGFQSVVLRFPAFQYVIDWWSPLWICTFDSVNGTGGKAALNCNIWSLCGGDWMSWGPRVYFACSRRGWLSVSSVLPTRYWSLGHIFHVTKTEHGFGLFIPHVFKSALMC
jgi:hypothetical protein